MSSLLNKLKGGDKRQSGNYDQTGPRDNYNSPSSKDNYNSPSSNTGYDNTTQGGYGNTTSPTHNTSSGFGNTQNTSSGYDNGALNSHSDGGRYHAPRGTAVDQGLNTQTVGPHSNDTMNKLDPRVDSDQSRMRQNNQQGYGEQGYNQSGYTGNQTGYGNTTQGPHSSNLANKADPRVDSDDSRAHHGYGTTTTTTTNTNTSTSIGHGTYGNQHGTTTDSSKRLPENPAHPTLSERINPKVDTDTSRRGQEYGNTGYGGTTGTNQYGTAQDSTKRLPQDPAHPTTSEKLNPQVDTDSSRRQEGYGGAGYGNTTGTGQYNSTHDSNKRLPEDAAHPTMMEKLNPKVDSDPSRRQEGYDNTGYGNTASSNQYGTTTHESNKRLPEDPNHPSVKEKVDPRYETDSSRKQEEYGNTGYGTATGRDQYGMSPNDPTKRLPEDPAHPTLGERFNKDVDTSRATRKEYENPGYENTGSSSAVAGMHSDMDSRRHGHNDQYAAGAAGAAGAYGATESSRHHTHPVHNDNSMMNRAHPNSSMHPSDKRYDSSRTNQETGPDGEYLPGPASNTAGPHKSDMANKLDPRVDSDQSKLEKEREREREGYGTTGTTGTSGPHYGNERERRLNEGQRDRRHEGTDTGIGSANRYDDQYSSNSPAANRDSGYGGQGSISSNMTHRKPVNEEGSYGNDRYSRGNDYDRSNPVGTSNNPAATSQSTYGNDYDENDFECAKCGHKNTHLRKNRADQYGNQKPSLADKLNPKVDATGDGKAGFMK